LILYKVLFCNEFSFLNIAIKNPEMGDPPGIYDDSGYPDCRAENWLKNRSCLYSGYG
jgi:hypothetical protein